MTYIRLPNISLHDLHKVSLHLIKLLLVLLIKIIFRSHNIENTNVPYVNYDQNDPFLNYRNDPFRRGSLKAAPSCKSTHFAALEEMKET